MYIGSPVCQANFHVESLRRIQYGNDPEFMSSSNKKGVRNESFDAGVVVVHKRSITKQQTVYYSMIECIKY